MGSPFVIGVKDAPHNAAGNGQRDDTQAIQSAINAAQSLSTLVGANVGPTVYFPPGEYVITDTLLLDTARGLYIEGSGVSTTIVGRIPYVVGMRKPMMRFASTFSCALRNIGMAVIEEQYRCDGIHIETKVGYRLISTRLAIENVTIGGSGNIDDCVFIGGGVDANNDFHTLDNCSFEGYRRNGIHLDNSQVYGIAISRCNVGGARFSVQGQMNPDTTVVTVSEKRFTRDDVGTYVWLVDMAGSGVKVRRRIIAVSDTAHITLDEPTYLTGRTLIEYGAQSSVRCDRGNFSWRDGGVGGNLFCDYYVSPIGSGANVIEGAISEDSRALLYMYGPTPGNHKMTMLSNVRFSGDGLASDHPFAIEWRTTGSLLVQNCNLGDPYALRPTRILIDFGGGAFHDLQAIFIGTTIDSTHPTEKIFQGYRPSEIINCKHTSGPTNSTETIGRQPFEWTRAMAGEDQVLEIGGWRESKITVKGALTLKSFAHMPVGLGTPIRLYVKYDGDATGTAITWPKNVVWPAGGAPSVGIWKTTDVFEFCSDGTNIFGKVIGQGYVTL
jgi:hypothetical protein